MDLTAVRQTLLDQVYGKAGAAARGASWFSIRQQADSDTTVIRIYGVIGWETTAEEFAAALAEVKTDNIQVQVSSPGGLAYDGIAIYNALRAHPARVEIRVDGIAASAASVIAMAGDHVVMMGGSQMMIHDAWGLAIGPADEMRSAADQLDKQSENCAAIYAERAGGDETSETMRERMKAETFLSAQETVDMGLADEVLNPKRRPKPDDDDPDDGEEPKSFADLLGEHRAEFDAAVAEAVAASLTQHGASDPAGSDPVGADGPSDVDGETAARLLASLTFGGNTHE